MSNATELNPGNSGFEPAFTGMWTANPERSARLKRRPLVGLIGLLILGAVFQALRAFPTKALFGSEVKRLAVVAVDRGEIRLTINEAGTLDSGVAPPVKCRVEAMLGRVSVPLTGVNGRRFSGTRTSSSPRATASISTRGRLTGGRRRSSAATANLGTGSSKGTSATIAAKPSIRSFSYYVTPHIPLRGSSYTPSYMISQYNIPGITSPGGDRAGATRIKNIVDEGSAVKAGEIVCELESSKFEEEIDQQKIRVSQAQAWLEQSKTNFEVNTITVSEYEEGIYPQDHDLICQYTKTCELELERAERTLKWSEEMRESKLRTGHQVQSDKITVEVAQVNLKQAHGMMERLERFTKDRIMMTLQAKLEASRADMLAQELAYQRELDRLEQLKRMVENCVLKAPHDGTVVYANQANWRGRIEVQIQEGAVVRQGQAIFSLPSPSNLRIQARINESRITFVESGMPVTIRIDAFPDRQLSGTIAEIVPIPAPGAPLADTKAYTATVTIDEPFEELRPGLSAEIVMHVQARQDVVRIPVESLSWVGPTAYAALTKDHGATWDWQPIKVGLVNEVFAEVKEGLSPGDLLIAAPDELKPPETQEHTGSTVRN